MAFEAGDNMYIPGLSSGADYSAADVGQDRFVKMSADLTIVICGGATDIPVGVLTNRPKLGEAARVCYSGTVKIQADATLTFGQQIGTSVDGQAAPYAAGTATTNRIVGTVIQGTTNAGERITAIINCAAGPRGA